MAFRVRATLSALCLAAGCAGQSPAASPGPAIVPSDLYPFRAGNAWSYDVETGEASTTLGITRVVAFDGRIAAVQTGRAVVRYEVLPEGIRVPPGDEWLLRTPLVEGATWPGRGGRTARLSSTDMAVETPAGAFDHCVEVVEMGGRLEVEVHTIYCPRVGPVSVRSTMRSNVSDRAVTVSAQLRGYAVSLAPSPDP